MFEITQCYPQSTPGVHDKSQGAEHSQMWPLGLHTCRRGAAWQATELSVGPVWEASQHGCHMRSNTSSQRPRIGKADGSCHFASPQGIPSSNGYLGAGSLRRNCINLTKCRANIGF